MICVTAQKSADITAHVTSKYIVKSDEAKGSYRRNLIGKWTLRGSP